MSIDLLTPTKKGSPLNIEDGEANLSAIEGAINGIEDGSIPVGNAVKFDGKAPSAYMQQTDYVRGIGNLLAPLTWLPLKKNLLTQQGQSICTFTRSGTATYRDRYGMLKTAAADTARFNENGLLLEGASTNLITYSEQFDNAAWAKTRASVTANATTSPDGNVTADKLVEDTTASNSHVLSKILSTISGTVYTISIFVKSAERSQISIGLSSEGKSAIFDLSTKSVVSASSGVTASIKELGNGWFRVSCIYTSTITGSSQFAFALALAGTTLYTGDGASGLYVFGAQLEVKPFATSYIPTTTSAAARAFNNCYLPQAENMPAYSGDFSIIFDMIPDGVEISTLPRVISDGSLVQIRYTSDYKISFLFGTAEIVSSAVYAARTKLRVCTVKSGSVLYLYINGTLVGSTMVLTIPVNTTNLYLGSRNGSDNFYFGALSNLRIYDRALTGQEVAVA